MICFSDILLFMSLTLERGVHFLTAIWLPHGQLWAIIEKAASLT